MQKLADIMRKAWSLMPNMLRLSAFIAVVYVVAMALAVHKVHAEVEQMMLGLGEELMRYPGAQQEGARQVFFNGAAIELRVDTVSGGMSEVLGHYERKCREYDGALGQDLAELMKDKEVAEKLEASEKYDPTLLDGVMAAQTPRAGFVLCLDMGTERRGLDKLAERAKKMMTTGDLSEIGHLRYAWAKPIEGAEPERTMLLTMWSDSELNLFRLLPIDGRDVDGQDIADIPRPPQSTRILSSWESGKPYGVTMYAARGESPEVLERYYRALLPEHGWRLFEPRAHHAHKLSGEQVLAAQKADRLVMLVFSQDRANSGVVTVLSSDSL